MDHIISLSQYQYVKNKYIYAGAGFFFLGGELEYSWLLDMGSTVWLYHWGVISLATISEVQ